jgi:aromatic-L-amino-acid decarboxylase
LPLVSSPSSSVRVGIQSELFALFNQLDLVATVGTTSSGAIDNLKEIGPIRKSRSKPKITFHTWLTVVSVQDFPDVWLHIDAAWAGVAMSCPEYRESLGLNEINQYATSYCTNFHKAKHSLFTSIMTLN